MEHSLKEISWDVDEPTYRADPALSYSTLSRFVKTGFNGLPHLFDKVESPSLTFGSCVDTILTDGMDEFKNRFMVADMPDLSDNLMQIVTYLYNTYSSDYVKLSAIPDDIISAVGKQFNYYANDKYANYRVKLIREECTDVYSLMFAAQNKTLINTECYTAVLKCVDTLRTSETTKQLFAADNPFNTDIEHLYQLKFKFSNNGVDYRSMADLIIVDHKNKIVCPFDLKTSGKPEWDFYKSFVEWNYHIQARLYWRNIRDNMNKHSYFKDFRLENYRFIVINKETLTPLVWEFDKTKAYGTLKYGSVEFRDPFDIGEELNKYLPDLASHRVPIGINQNGTNSLDNMLEKFMI